MEYLEKLFLKITMPSFYSDANSQVYYKVVVAKANYDNQIFDKTFKDFEDLHSFLYNVTPNLPNFPSKQLFKMNDQQIFDKKQELEQYLNDLCQRLDILLCPQFQSFLQINLYKNDYLPQEIGSIDGENQHFIDYVYIEEAGVFLMLSYSIGLIQTVENIIEPVGSFLGSSDKNIGTGLHKGKIAAYKLNKENFTFAKLWEEKLYHKPTCLHWDKDLTILAIGLSNGMILCLRIASEKNYEEYQKFCSFENHLSEVTAVGLYAQKGILYSASTDKSLLLVKLATIGDNNKAFKIEELNFEFEILNLVLDKTNRRMFMSTRGNKIFVMSLEPPVKTLKILQIPKYDALTGIQLQLKLQYLIVSGQSGTTYIFELGFPGKEHLISLLSTYNLHKNLNSLYFSSKSKSLLFNYRENVIFFKPLQNEIYYSLQAKLGEIVKIELIEDQKILAVVTNSRIFKLWCLSEYTFENFQNKKYSQYLQYQDQKIPGVKTPLTTQEIKAQNSSANDILNRLKQKKQQNISYQTNQSNQNIVKEITWNEQQKKIKLIQQQKEAEKLQKKKENGNESDSSEDDLEGWNRI